MRKSFTKLDMDNREQIAVNSYCKELVVQDAAKQAAVQSEFKVLKARNISARLTAFSATPYATPSQERRYTEKNNPYLTQRAMDEEGGAQVEGEGDAVEDWDEEIGPEQPPFQRYLSWRHTRVPRLTAPARSLQRRTIRRWETIGQCAML